MLALLCFVLIVQLAVALHVISQEVSSYPILYAKDNDGAYAVSIVRKENFFKVVHQYGVLPTGLCLQGVASLF